MLENDMKRVDTRREEMRPENQEGKLLVDNQGRVYKDKPI